MAIKEEAITIEEAKTHGKKVIAEQADILRRNLREQKEHNKTMYV